MTDLRLKHGMSYERNIWLHVLVGNRPKFKGIGRVAVNEIVGDSFTGVLLELKPPLTNCEQACEALESKGSSLVHVANARDKHLEHTIVLVAEEKFDSFADLYPDMAVNNISGAIARAAVKIAYEHIHPGMEVEC